MDADTSFISKIFFSLVGFAISLILPSTGIIQKYLGVVGVFAYILMATIILILLIKYKSTIAVTASKFSEIQVVLLAVLTFVLILTAFYRIYPVANSGIYGRGSDNEEALNIATKELLQGCYPYYPKTYLGNPISPMPGALVLAIPFVLLGNSAYQNFFWLLIFFLVMKSYLQDIRSALLLLWTLLILSPIVLYMVFVGSDYMSNSLYVLIFILGIIKTVSQPQQRNWKKTWYAVLLGIGLSSRANFIMILPLVFLALFHNAGWKSALKYTTITCIAFTMITVPFYLYDAPSFTPIHTISKINQFRSLVPYVHIVIPVTNGIIALLLAFFQPVKQNLSILFRNCTFVLAFPVLCVMVLSVLKFGYIDIELTIFGAFFLFFGAAAFWENLFNIPDGPMSIKKSTPLTP